MATSTQQHGCVRSRVSQKVDYSKWARCARAKQKNNETDLGTNVEEPTAADDNHQTTGSDLGPPSRPTITRRHKSTDGIILPHMPIGPTKKNLEVERAEVSVKRKDKKIKTLSLLARSQKKSVEDLEALCAVIQQSNQLLAQQIRDTDQKSLLSAGEFLDRHEKLGTSISAFNDWGQSQITEAKLALDQSEEESKRRLSGLQKELSLLHSRLGNAQVELHTLKTYKDKEYPVKVLMISSLKRELEYLQETQQEEYEDMKQQCHNAKMKLAEQITQSKQKVLISTAKENSSRIPHFIKQMAVDNKAMKAVIEIYKKEIEKLGETNETLSQSVQDLRLARKNVKEQIFEDVFTTFEKCTADMDVVLNIPKAEWLPI
ncbi:uncharacterized protein C20orf96 homolog [Engraulis encrasicolus]|uniref:uncharacterized protein C20orf96 homolog n=1 Tax=Engraulis encrasicolus TaxID=184585 RepID=UPI002FD3FFE8